MRLYDEEKHPEQRGFSMFLYVITAFSAIFQYFQATLILGLILFCVAWFMTKAQRVTAASTPYMSHVEWTSRTLFLGMFVFFPIAFAVACYMIWQTIDFETLKASVEADGAPGAAFSVALSYIKSTEPQVRKIVNITSTPPLLWWLWRCWIGFSRAQKHEPMSWGLI